MLTLQTCHLSRRNIHFIYKKYTPQTVFFALLHPITVIGDHLGELKTAAEELGIPFECKDHCIHDELQTGKGM